MNNLIVWKDAYSVGDQHIDDQHKKLISIINGLANTRGDESAESPAVLIDYTLRELYSYACTHFEDEEKLMVRIGYPRIAEHTMYHMRLVADFEKLTANRDSDLFVMDLMRMLATWLDTHILVDDKGYADYVRAYNEKQIYTATSKGLSAQEKQTVSCIHV